MDNKKKLTVILAVLAVVCVFAVLVFSGVIGDGIKTGEEPTTDSDPAVNSDIATLSKGAGGSTSPYLESEIENIYYNMDKSTGEVSFYEYSSNAFTAVEATGTYDVSVKLSEQTLKTKITYYKDGDEITGYGLYLGSQDEFDLYPYAFFSLVNYGENYKNAKDGGCILLVDTTADDFYSNSKIYEEPFAFTYSDSSSKRILSEANRTVGLNGAKRSDYTLINQSTIEGSAEHFLFFSGRYYAEDDPTVDLMRSGGSGNNTDNIRIAKDVLGYWAEYTDDGIMYIATNADGDVVLRKCNTQGEETEDVKTFTGVKRDGIIVKDGYIYLIASNTVYDIEADKEIKITYDKASDFTADIFAAENGKIAVRGYLDRRNPVLLIVAEDGSVSGEYANEFFRTAVNPYFVGDNAVVWSQTGENFSYYIF